jgi:hypothetical protein
MNTVGNGHHFMSKTYSAFDSTVSQWFDVTLDEYPEGGLLKSPFSGEYFGICPRKISFGVSSKQGGIPNTCSTISVDSAKTLGRQSELNATRNAQKIADDQYAAKLKRVQRVIRDTPEGATPIVDHIMRDGKSEAPWRPGTDGPMLELNNMDKKELQTYFETGKKPLGLADRSTKKVSEE